jgi:hypothetical protein|tara:strand:+ start:175 stop:870 length:696 start_codon:yes stop_codon:yes gene_type:complete
MQLSKDIKITTHNLPSVVMLECSLPDELIDSLNEYLDEYMKQEDRKSLSHTLVGQIHQGEQLLMDHKDPMLEGYYEFITEMGVSYLDAYAKITGIQHTGRRIDIDELWSVHSFEGDYNPIHDHGTKTLMGISTTTWTKVPAQIGRHGEPEVSADYTLYNDSGACDGFLAFTYGRNEIMNSERLRPPQSTTIKPQVGRQLMFPSWLQHMVYPFFGEGERRTVAANLNCWPAD